MTGAALVVQGDALHLPLPDASVDAIITSPPYWALRAYQAGPGEIGSEPTPQAFLEALWAATAEMMRVLKPSGSMFVDLGDKYANDGAGNAGKTPGLADHRYKSGEHYGRIRSMGKGTPTKSLMLLPERYRIGCVDQLGLIARAVIVWDKPNGLPESVQDRVRRSHEDWVHLTLQPRYYSALDEVREAHVKQNWENRSSYKPGSASGSIDANGNHQVKGDAGLPLHPLGKLPGSVWTIPSEPLRLPEHLGVQHYAAFPSEWPRRLILGFSPPGICLDCGQGRVPVVNRENRPLQAVYNGSLTKVPGEGREDWRTGVPSVTQATIVGYACSCTPYTDHPERRGTDFHAGTDRATQGMNDGNGGERFRRCQEQLANPRGPVREYYLDGWKPPPTRPAIILDPFGGTGTTAMVARALGRIGVSVDLSAAYGRAARWRAAHDGAKAVSRTNLERQGQLL